MFFQTQDEDNNTLASITTWYGYDHNYKTNYGTFYDMENLSSDYYPVMTARKTRPLLATGTDLRGVLYADDRVSWIDGTTLTYYDTEYDLSSVLDTSDDGLAKDLIMLQFGVYILIFPDNAWFNTTDKTFGTMGSHFAADAGKTITYSVCASDGNPLNNVTVSETAPENPSSNDYWLCTEAGCEGLNIWYATQQMWTPVATTYIKIQVQDATLTDYFSEGDTVFMNTMLEDINDGSTIRVIGTDYIVVTGLLQPKESVPVMQYTQTTSEDWTLEIDRKIPKMDYVCCDKNRVWGCWYGYSDGEILNEIYACKLGDFKNWYTFDGLTNDSYSLSVGAPGVWTACATYNGYPTFFKEDVIIKIYGSYPAEYQTVTTNCRGVQDGSYRSLVALGEYLFYKSPYDICVYDGSTPTSISEPLGRDTHFYNGIAGACGNKYYIQLDNAASTKYFFVYDLTYGLWEREDAIAFRNFSNTWNGQMFGVTKTELIGYGTTDNTLYTHQLVGEEYTTWYAVTGDLGLDIEDFKFVSKLTIRYHLPYTGEVAMYISYDDKPYDTLATFRGSDDVRTESFSMNPYRCDHFKIKFEGHGDFRIYSLYIRYEAGSEDDNGYA